jgi:polysaccharide biosynthesis/export protein
VRRDSCFARSVAHCGQIWNANCTDKERNSRIDEEESVIGKICGVVLLSCTAIASAAEVPPKDLVAANTREHTGNAAATGPLNYSALSDDYCIGPGDVLSISVWKEPDASVPSVAVRADGRISLPLIKEVEVAGLKPSEAERMLSAKLGRYIHGADVTIIVSQVNSRKVYMVGGVKTVGAIDLRGQLTVLQALTQAGGLTDYAKRKRIYVLRNENGRQVKLPFNYAAVIKGENIEQNIVLNSNDTIVVPQ